MIQFGAIHGVDAGQQSAIFYLLLSSEENHFDVSFLRVADANSRTKNLQYIDESHFHFSPTLSHLTFSSSYDHVRTTLNTTSKRDCSLTFHHCQTIKQKDSIRWMLFYNNIYQRANSVDYQYPIIIDWQVSLSIITFVLRNKTACMNSDTIADLLKYHVPCSSRASVCRGKANKRISFEDVRSMHTGPFHGTTSRWMETPCYTCLGPRAPVLAKGLKATPRGGDGTQPSQTNVCTSRVIPFKLQELVELDAL